MLTFLERKKLIWLQNFETTMFFLSSCVSFNSFTISYSFSSSLTVEVIFLVSCKKLLQNLELTTVFFLPAFSLILSEFSSLDFELENFQNKL